MLNLIIPDREFSEQENRYLTQVPKFTLSSLTSGEFTSKFEKYTTDQFILRDEWISLKAGTELASGKHENNGVYYCGDDTLIERFDGSNTEQYGINLEAVNALAENSDIPVYFALIPGARIFGPISFPNMLQATANWKSLKMLIMIRPAIPVIFTTSSVPKRRIHILPNRPPRTAWAPITAIRRLQTPGL
jgi:hypothetical protein